MIILLNNKLMFKKLSMNMKLLTKLMFLKELSVVQKIAVLGNILFTTIWIYAISGAQCFLSSYIILGAASIIASIINKKNDYQLTNHKVLNLIYFVIFMFIPAFGNHELWLNSECPLMQFSIGKLNIDIVMLLILCIGSLLATFNILCFLSNYKFSSKINKSNTKIFSNRAVSWFCFISITLIYMTIFFMFAFPGIKIADTINQIVQISTNEYSNHHPIIHTLLIKETLEIGKFIGLAENSICIYCVIQILFIAFCFSYAVYVIYKNSQSIIPALALFIFYLLFPYNIVFSMFVWKDTIFAGFCLLFCIEISILASSNIKSKKLHLMLLALWTIGICLFRSNGFFALTIFIIGFAWLIYKSEKQMLLSILVAFSFAFLLKYPCLMCLNIPQATPQEHLNVAIQQVFAAYNENNDFSSDEIEYFNEAINLEDKASEYTPGNSDKWKVYINSKNSNYLNENFPNFFVYYFKIGIRHPLSYLISWVDQTKGYWNSGYKTWMSQLRNTEKNNANIEKSLITKNQILNIFSFIKAPGFYFWLFLFALYKSIKDKNRTCILIEVFIIALYISVFLSVPLHSEYRYIYFSFICYPFVGYSLGFIKAQYPSA